MLIKLSGGIVYDPEHGVDGKVRDIHMRDGKIVAPEAHTDERIKAYDVSGKIVMAGAIDVHTHIGGGKSNIARVMFPDDHAQGLMAANDVLRAGCGHVTPTTAATGYRYAQMGYTACFEPAVVPVNARHAHMEMADTPMIDKGGYVMLGNDDIFLDMLATGTDAQILRDYVAWMLDATQCIGVKVVNPGGINAFKFNQRKLDVDTQSVHYPLTPRDIVRTLAHTVDTLGIPHPLHVHASNLGSAGNYRSTIETVKAVGGHRIHLAHVQFHSYGNEGKFGFSSRAAEIAELINASPNVTADVGQIMFGQTITASGDSMQQYAHHHHAAPKKWTLVDIECEAGCGVVPFEYQDKNFVNALQWAIGLEIFLLVNDPWRVFLTTDHPNGAPFTSYPHLIRLLMDKSFRNDMLGSLHPTAARMSHLAVLQREYSLYEIAIMTRAAPARVLGLKSKGHLGAGADADIVVYNPCANAETMFGNPLYVFKGGELAVENGHIKASPATCTHVVKPEYDASIHKYIKPHFDRYRCMQWRNVAISSDEMAELIGSQVQVGECRHPRPAS